jgi:ribosomal protein S18 acetylase RimI-like enzyme
VPLSVRPCAPDECERVLDLWRRADAIPSATDTVEELQRLVRADPGALLVAEDDGAIVGSVIAGWDGWRGSIYRLAVTPERRRRGLARRLVTEAERRLAARGALRLTALVAGDEPHAVGFWDQAPGFERAPRYVRYVKMLAPRG